MKSTLSALLATALLLLPLHAAPKGKGKGKGGGAKAEEPAAPVAESPAKALEPYIEKIDLLLAIQPPPAPAPFYHGAPARLAILKQEFTAKQKTAEKADAAKYTAAIATCNLITAAIDERVRTASSIKTSATMHGSEKLNAPPRKDALNQGVRGGDLAKAVGEIEEGRRERDEKQAGRLETAKTDDAMTAGAINRWKQRKIELRNQITASYARIGG